MDNNTKNKVRFLYLQLGKGRVTLALETMKKGETEFVSYAPSFCSPKDRFTRERGRKISTGRLQNGSVFRNFVEVEDKHYVDAAKKAFLADVKDYLAWMDTKGPDGKRRDRVVERNYPTWVVKAVKSAEIED